MKKDSFFFEELSFHAHPCVSEEIYGLHKVGLCGGKQKDEQ